MRGKLQLSFLSTVHRSCCFRRKPEHDKLIIVKKSNDLFSDFEIVRLCCSTHGKIFKGSFSNIPSECKSW